MADRATRVGVLCQGGNLKRLLTLLTVFLVATQGAFAEPALVVEVKDPSGDYRQKDHRGHRDFSKQFRLSFQVTTPSIARQEFSSWQCTIYQNWTTDNPNVSIDKWPCTRNEIAAHMVTRDKPFHGEVTVKVNEGFKGIVTFRLGFVPYTRDSVAIYPPKELGTFWSNQIELNVVE